MSRLDSFIRRMEAQRAIIAHVRQRIRGLDGPVIEFGLGHGRTYDHLRETFPERRIIVLDFEAKAEHGPLPPPEDLLLGDIRETGQSLAGIGAAFLHSDIGAGDAGDAAETAAWLPRLVSMLLASGGLALADAPLCHEELMPLSLPYDIEAGRYYLYRRR
jgi:S-adenosyl-L-methionine methyltransferase